MNSAGFGGSFEWAMQDDLDMPDLRQEQLAVLDLTAIGNLWVGEAIIAVLALESWEPRLLCM